MASSDFDEEKLARWQECDSWALAISLEPKQFKIHNSSFDSISVEAVGELNVE
jgi:hypothetical protein